MLLREEEYSHATAILSGMEEKTSLFTELEQWFEETYGLRVYDYFCGLTNAGRPRLRLLDVRAVPAALVVALFTIPYMATQSFLVSYAEARGLDVPTGAFFTVYAVALMALRVLLGRAFDRVGFVPFVVASGVSAAGSLALLALMDGPVGLLLAAPLMAGAVGPEHVGLANSTYYMGFDIGMTLGPVIGGALFGSVDLAWFFPALALTVPAAIAVAALSGGVHQNRSTGQTTNEM